MPSLQLLCLGTLSSAAQESLHSWLQGIVAESLASRAQVGGVVLWQSQHSTLEALTCVHTFNRLKSFHSVFVRGLTRLRFGYHPA